LVYRPYGLYLGAREKLFPGSLFVCEGGKNTIQTAHGSSNDPLNVFFTAPSRSNKEMDFNAFFTGLLFGGRHSFVLQLVCSLASISGSNFLNQYL
jgi:hypothetical protein